MLPIPASPLPDRGKLLPSFPAALCGLASSHASSATMLVIMPTQSPTIPRLAEPSIQFCETHAPVWAVSPTFLGLDGAQVAQLAGLAAAARAAFEAAEAARLASMAATTMYHDALATMRSYAGDLVAVIRAHAQSTHDHGVFAAAQIDPPAARHPLGPPTIPVGVGATLGGDGSITLTWKSDNAMPSTGAYFEVQRKLVGERGYHVIGGTSLKTFKDDTIPAGAAGASYIITGLRGNRRGESSAGLLVQFGGGTPHAAMRMAA